METEFLGKLGSSNLFSGQKQVVSKKKKVSTEIESDFSLLHENNRFDK